MNQDTLWLTLSILTLGALTVLWLRRRMKLQRARTWPIAAGQVESTEVRLEGAGTQQPRYVADVIYSYNLNGQRYSGHLRRSFLLNGRAHKWIESYPKDSAITIHYDPAKAADSVLFDDEQVGARTA